MPGPNLPEGKNKANKIPIHQQIVQENWNIQHTIPLAYDKDHLQKNLLSVLLILNFSFLGFVYLCSFSFPLSSWLLGHSIMPVPSP